MSEAFQDRLWFQLLCWSKIWVPVPWDLAENLKCGCETHMCCCWSQQYGLVTMLLEGSAFSATESSTALQRFFLLNISITHFAWLFSIPIMCLGADLWSSAYYNHTCNVSMKGLLHSDSSWITVRAFCIQFSQKDMYFLIQDVAYKMLLHNGHCFKPSPSPVL